MQEIEFNIEGPPQECHYAILQLKHEEAGLVLEVDREGRTHELGTKEEIQEAWLQAVPDKDQILLLFSGGEPDILLYQVDKAGVTHKRGSDEEIQAAWLMTAEKMGGFPAEIPDGCVKIVLVSLSR